VRRLQRARGSFEGLGGLGVGLDVLEQLGGVAVVPAAGELGSDARRSLARTVRPQPLSNSGKRGLRVGQRCQPCRSAQRPSRHGLLGRRGKLAGLLEQLGGGVEVAELGAQSASLR